MNIKNGMMLTKLGFTLKQIISSKMKKAVLSLATAVFAMAAAQAQTARLQVIHNCSDAAADSVDVYVNGTLLLNNFSYRSATPYVSAPAGIPLNIGVAPKNSASVADTIYNLTTTLTANQRYIAVAQGIVSATGYTPTNVQAPFKLAVFTPARAAAMMGTNVDVLVYHGATDAPVVDVRSGVNTLVEDISYGEFATGGYLSLPTADYRIRVTTSTGATTVQTYSAPLQTLGLGRSGLTVLASGFLNPAANSGGPAFGLFAVDSNGGVLTPLPTAAAQAYARAQIIHNSGDAAADSVDVYVNGTKLLDNLAYRTATPFIDVPSGTPLTIAVAPKNSTSVAAAVYTTTATLDSGDRYVLTATGLVSPTGYAPNAMMRPFNLAIFAGAREMAMMANQTDVLVGHGSTDAPTVDITSAGTTLVNNLRYGTYAPAYLSLPLADYGVEVRDSTGATAVAAYGAPLQTLGLGGASLTVLASGFLTPASNSNGAAFGLFAVPASGGPFIPLPSIPLSVSNVVSNSAEFTLAPNPSNGMMSVIHNLNGAVDYTVLDLTGRVVRTGNLEASQTLDVSALTPGAYLLQLRNGSASAVSRFVRN